MPAIPILLFQFRFDFYNKPPLCEYHCQAATTSSTISSSFIRPSHYFIVNSFLQIIDFMFSSLLILIWDLVTKRDGYKSKDRYLQASRYSYAPFLALIIGRHS